MATPTIEIPVRHEVKEGDNLSLISQKYYGTQILWPRIAEENQITEPNLLRPGMELKIPGIPQYWKHQTGLIIKNRNVFHAYSPFQGSDEYIGSPLVLIPPLPRGKLFTMELSLSIAQLCLNKDSADPAGFENDDFTFRWKPDPAKANKSNDLVAQITIKGNNVWKTAPAERKKFRKNFLEFRIFIEKMELDGTIISGGLDIVTWRLAEAIPGNFEETLFFRYGFNSGFGSSSSPYFDLRPGMRLQIVHDTSQRANDPKLNIADGNPHTIVRDQDGRIAFDAFLAAISTPATPFSPAISNAGGLMDMQAAGNPRRHYRLIYPTQSRDPVTLIGADTLEDLKAATEAYTTSGKVAVTNTGERAVIAFKLPAEVVALPEIGVDIRVVTGTQVTQPFQYVPLGKTVRQLVEDFVPAGNPKDLFTGGIRPARVHRLFTPAIGQPEYRDVLFELTPDLIMDYRIFDLPLVTGDRVEVYLPSG